MSDRAAATAKLAPVLSTPVSPPLLRMHTSARRFPFVYRTNWASRELDEARAFVAQVEGLTLAETALRDRKAVSEGLAPRRQSCRRGSVGALRRARHAVAEGAAP